MGRFKGSIPCDLLVPIAALGLFPGLLRERLLGEVDDLVTPKNGSLSFLDVPLIGVFHGRILIEANYGVALRLCCCLPPNALGSSISILTCVSR